MKRSFPRLWFFFCGLGLLSVTGFTRTNSASTNSDEAQGIRVQGPGVRPHLGFACCEHGVPAMQNLMADPRVIASLKDLQAQVAIPIADFSSERAAAVQRLNAEGIPTIAWIELDKSDGVYLNADTTSKAAARVVDFENWTKVNRLQWTAVGLDIEPNFGEFAQFKNHRWQMLTTLLRRSVNKSRMTRARRFYAALISGLQSRGFAVQTYQMPYLPAERAVHSTVLDRLLGTVDVRGNEEYLMLYTSFARQVGAGMIWSLGNNAQAIAIGVTDGDTPAGTGAGPLDWNEFSRDLIVASHYTDQIGIYDLEGCVRQGFLPRLEAMDWSQTVVLPIASIHRAQRMGRILRIVLWLASHIFYFLLVFLLMIGWLGWRWRKRRRAAYRLSVA